MTGYRKSENIKRMLLFFSFLVNENLIFFDHYYDRKEGRLINAICEVYIGIIWELTGQ